MIRRALAAVAAAAAVLLPAVPAAAVDASPDSQSGWDRSQEQAEEIRNELVGMLPWVGDVADSCEPQAPTPQHPDTGLAGFFYDPPGSIPPPTDPWNPADNTTIFQQYGFAGFGGSTYDLGCAFDITNWGDAIGASSGNRATNVIVGVAVAATAATSGLEAQVYDPAWVDGLLGTFADRTIEVVRDAAWLRYMPVALIIAGTALAFRSGTRGDMSGATTGIAWMLLVIGLSAMVITGPLQGAKYVQGLTEAASAELSTAATQGMTGNPGADPVSASTAASAAVVEAVHYNGWLRRTFGSSNSDVAAEYGPRLYKASTMTWREHAASADPAQAERILEAKAAAWNEAAAAIKEQHPAAYRWMQGKEDRTTAALLELAAALSVALVRGAALFLVALAIIAVVVFGVVWLCASPWLVQPRGRRAGERLLNAMARAVGYGFVGLFGWFGFSMYVEVVLDPGTGLSEWPALVFLLLGAFVTWSVVRPDRKALSLATMGRVNGSSRTLRRLTGLLAVKGLEHKSRMAAAQSARGDTDDEGDDPADSREPRTYRHRPEDQSTPPPPAPASGRPVPQQRALPTPEPLEGVVVDTPAREPAGEVPPATRIVPGQVVHDDPEPDTGRYPEPPPPASPGSAAGTDVEVYQRNAPPPPEPPELGYRSVIDMDDDDTYRREDAT